MQYKQCTTCVVDNTAEEFQSTPTGCNFCDRARLSLKQIEAEKKNLHTELKAMVTGKDYDCLIGLSGGVDSSYVLVKAVELGLKPLCFSVDNGWNDPKADENIMRLVEGLKVPFFRYTIDLPKFKELQSAFIKAGQKNVEIPTDNILMATTYEMAAKYGIKTILSGGNVATESIMPFSWGYHARDTKHLKGVYRWATGKKLKGLPTMGLLKFNYYKHIKKMRVFYLLDYLQYNREEAIKELTEKYGYQSYGEKHHESVFTQWFQNFYLYEKFGIDKRKAHLSSLIVSGQMTRDEAMKELEKCPVYPKFGIEEKVLKYPKRHYREFPNDEKLFNRIGKIVKFLRRLKRCK